MTRYQPKRYSRRPVPGAPKAVIAVMGITGSGKSTFIRSATGNCDILIGHALISCTENLAEYTFHLDGFNVTLVDTPGFNDTYKSETEVLEDIAIWLEDSYKEQTTLNGIIYLHRISDLRMEGSALRNLTMFQKLCGPDPLKNVILGSTFWEKVKEEEALAREEELKSTPEFWGNMLELGSKPRRVLNTERDCALELISELLRKTPMPLVIQQELVDQHMPLMDTSAGQALNTELLRLQENYDKQISDLKKQLRETAAQDKAYMKLLEKEHQKLETELKRVYQQQKQLRDDGREERRRLRREMDEKLKQIASKEPSFDEVIQFLEKSESKISPDQREKMKKAIQGQAEQAEKEKPAGWRTWKGTGKILLKALAFILPTTTAIVLGVAVPAPQFGSS